MWKARGSEKEKSVFKATLYEGWYKILDKTIGELQFIYLIANGIQFWPIWYFEVLLMVKKLVFKHVFFSTVHMCIHHICI